MQKQATHIDKTISEVHAVAVYLSQWSGFISSGALQAVLDEKVDGLSHATLDSIGKAIIGSGAVLSLIQDHDTKELTEWMAKWLQGEVLPRLSKLLMSAYQQPLQVLIDSAGLVGNIINAPVKPAPDKLKDYLSKKDHITSAVDSLADLKPASEDAVKVQFLIRFHKLAMSFSCLVEAFSPEQYDLDKFRLSQEVAVKLRVFKEDIDLYTAWFASASTEASVRR